MEDAPLSSSDDPQSEMEEEVKIDGMENPAREHELGSMLQNLPGIKSVSIAHGSVSIIYDPTQIVAQQIHEKMRRAGFVPGDREVAPIAPPLPP